METLTRSLHLMPAAFFTVSGDGQSSNTSSIEGLLSLALCCLRAGEPRLRYTAAHTLAVVAAGISPALTIHTLNALLSTLLKSCSDDDNDVGGSADEMDQIAALEAIYRILLHKHDFCPSWLIV